MRNQVYVAAMLSGALYATFLGGPVLGASLLVIFGVFWATAR